MSIEYEERSALGIKFKCIKGDSGSWEGPSREFQPLADAILKHVKKRELVVTAGGCQGVYSRLWREYGRFDKVVTAEPDPDNFALLEQNAAGDWCTRLACALGAELGTGTLYRHGNANRGMHSMTRDGQGDPLEVIVRTIDSLELPTLDVIQLDVEGYELSVLMGASESISRHHPVISVETCTSSVTNFLTMHGYREVKRAGSDTVFAV